MNKTILLWILTSLFSVTLVSCHRPQMNQSSLKIQFPQVKSLVQNSSVMSGPSSVSTGFTGAYPINCYMVMVSGPESDLQKSSCGRKTEGGFPLRRFGVWAGGVSDGDTMSLEVPAGSDRVVMIAGFYSQSGSCVDFHKSNTMSGLSQAYFLGEVGQLELAGGQTTEVKVSMAFSPANWFDFCEGSDLNFRIQKTTTHSQSPSVNQAGSNHSLTTTGQYSGHITIHGGNQQNNMMTTSGKYKVQNFQLSH